MAWKMARSVCSSAVLALALATQAWTPAHAGGGGQNVVLIVDPDHPDAGKVALHYARARGIPAANVLVMEPGAADYAAFRDWQIPALLDTVEARGIGDHADLIVLPPNDQFYVAAPGLVDPGPCPAPFGRIALPSAYTLAYVADEVAAGGLNVQWPNNYYATTNAPVAFDANQAWLSGQPSTSPSARRYLLGWSLGYAGDRGNTVTETLQMIDRSVGADGTQPSGTYYFMRTTDQARSGPRELAFLGAQTALTALGAQVETIDAVLPVGRHDILGLMTGAADPGVEGADLTILPGAYTDHLTSYAATFDGGGQMKVSSWIRKGASASLGTVEEPCNFPGKFPHPRLFVWAYQGMALGESTFRSLGYAPFHGMPYGDPLAQPFARAPELEVRPGWEAESLGGPVSGTLTMPFTATMAGGSLATLEALVDGVRRGSAPVTSSATTGSVSIDTTSLPDGSHDLLVVATEGSGVRAQAHWRSRVRVDNQGRTIDIVAKMNVPDDPESPRTRIDVTAAGAVEIRLLDGFRVMGAVSGDSGSFVMPEGWAAGQAEVRAEADYPDGGRSAGILVSPPTQVPGDLEAPPTAHSYQLDIVAGSTGVVDLPVTGGGALATEIVSAPAEARLHTEGGTTWISTPEDAAGDDHVVFRATSAAGASAPATVTLRYCQPPVITSAPDDAQACVGAAADFDVGATGKWLSYEWTKDGELVPGAHGSRLSIENADQDDAGDYEVTVRAWCGRVQTSLALPAVRLDVMSEGSACANAIWLPSLRNDGA